MARGAEPPRQRPPFLTHGAQEGKWQVKAVGMEPLRCTSEGMRDKGHLMAAAEDLYLPRQYLIVPLLHILLAQDEGGEMRGGYLLEAREKGRLPSCLIKEMAVGHRD